MRPLVQYPVVLAILALMTASCATESPTQPDPAPVVAVTTVSVSPDSASILPGATQSYVAQTLGPAGETLTGREVTWSTADASIAAVDGSTGLVTGVSQGVTTVTAASEGASGSAKVVMVPVPVASVGVTPERATLDVGNSAPFSARTLDASGAALPGRDVQWTTANPSVATVDPRSGLVTAWTHGSTSVIAAPAQSLGSASASSSSRYRTRRTSTLAARAAPRLTSRPPDGIFRPSE